MNFSARKFALLLFAFLFAAFSAGARESETDAKFPTFREEKLAVAARCGDYQTVEKLLAEKVSPDSRDRFNQPALLLALRVDKNKTSAQIRRVLDLLIEAGADVNVENEFGVTPFYAARVRAFLYKDETMADYLREKGARVKEKDIYGRSPFSHFHNLQVDEPPALQIWRNLIEGYTFQISKNEITDFARARFLFNDATVSMGAVYYGASELIAAACNAETKPLEQKDSNGENVYFYAARNYKSVMDYLGCFSKADFSGEEEMTKLFEKLNEKADFELFRKIHAGHLNVKNKQGETALDVALKMDAHLFAASYYLLENKPNAPKSDGLAPIFQAVRYKNYPAVSFLLSLPDTDMNLKLSDGETALIAAVKAGDELLVLLLLRGLKSETASPGAADDIHAGVSIKLKVPDLNLADGAGKTPLMWAAQNGNSKILKILLRNGADPRLKTKTGETALTLAKAKGHASIIYRLTNLKR